MSNFLDVKVISSNDKERLAPGTYDAVIHAIIQLGIQERKPYQGQPRDPKNMIKVLLEVPVDGAESHILGYREMPATVHELSGLYKFFHAAGLVKSTKDLGKLLSSEESVNSIIGKAVTVTVEDSEYNGKTYTQIDTVGILDPRLPQPVAVKEGFVFSMSKPDLSIFKDKLSKFTRRRISKALNVADLPAEFHQVLIEDSANEDVTAENVLK